MAGEKIQFDQSNTRGPVEGLRTEIDRIIQTSDDSRWRGELPIEPVAGVIVRASMALIDSYDATESQIDKDPKDRHPAAFYLMDGNTQIGVRRSIASESTIDLVTDQNGIGRGWTTLLSLNGFDNSLTVGRVEAQTRDTSRGSGSFVDDVAVPVPAHERDDALKIFADVVSAARWNFAYSELKFANNDHSDLVTRDFERRHKEIGRLAEELAADEAFFGSQADYYQGGLAQQIGIRVMAIFEDPDAEVSATEESKFGGDRIGKSLLLDETLIRLGTQTDRRLAIDALRLFIEIDAGLRSKISVDPDESNLTRFAKRFIDVYVNPGRSETEEE